MGVTFLAGPHARTRIGAARDFLLELPPGQPFLVVGHRRHAADRLTHEVAERRGALFGAHRFGFSVLVEVLAAPGLAARNLAPLTPLARGDLVAGLVRRARADETLDRLAGAAAGPGLVPALGATFEELRLAMLPPDAVERLDPTIGRLYERYTAALAAGRFADRAEALRIAGARIEDRGAPPSAPVGLPTVCLDVPLPDEASRRFAATLCSKAPEVLWTLPRGDAETEKALRSFGARSHSGGGLSAPPPDDDALAAAQRRLFTTDPDTSPPRNPEAVTVIAAPGAAAEALETVRVCLEAAREGVPFDRMAVLLAGGTDVQARRFPPAFARAGIPAFFESGARRPHPAGRAFLALLDCALEDVSASRFAEYLSLGQTPSPADGTAVAPRRWEQILLDATVLHGADRWERRLAAHDEELAAIEREETDEGNRRPIVRKRRDLDALRRTALPIVRRLDELRWTRRPWEEWAERLRDLATAALREPLGILEHLEGAGPAALDGKAGLTEVRDHLGRQLAEVVTRSRGPRYGRVWVGPIESARGLSFDVVVVPGVVEHGFPRVIRQDPLLRDRVRERLGEGLPRRRDRRERERTLLRIAVGAATRRLVLGYSSLELVEGRPQAPSYYLAEVFRAGRGEVPTLQGIREAAEQGSPMVPGVRAPVDSGRAVDQREFGLSRVMAALGSDRHHPRPGAATFVLNEPFLARALRQEWMREQRKWTQPDGFLLKGDSETAGALEEYRPGVRAYSATGLQAFSECPYQFFLKNALRLRAIERPEPRAYLDPLTRGSLIHDVLFHVGQDLRAMSPLTPDQREEALEALEARLREVAAEVHERTAPPVSTIWRDEIKGIFADLRQVVTRFAAERMTPVAAELGFGLGRLRILSDPASTPDPVTLPSGLRLHGSIDLVERLPGGQLQVTDYKTGKASIEPARDHRILFGGRALQPVLYALALEELAGERVGTGRLYYATGRGRFRDVVVDTGSDEARDALSRFIEYLDEAIRLGRFPAAPYRKGFFTACDWCDYRSICGPRPRFHHRRKPKRARALAPLNAVRAMP